MSFKIQCKNLIQEWGLFANRRLEQMKPRLQVFHISPTGLTALIGVRRCGKTAQALCLANNKYPDKFLYINFEDPLFIEFSHYTVFDQIIETYMEMKGELPRCVVFDELQVITGWERWVRKAHDLKRFEIIITGSSSKLLSRELGTALSGRALCQIVWPLSFKEYLAFRNIDFNLNFAFEKIGFHYLKFRDEGGFPETVFIEDMALKRELLRQYFNDIVLKDIISRYSIKEKWQLDKVIFHLMQNPSSHHTSNAISKGYQISVDTVLRFLDILNEAFVIFPVYRYHKNLKIQNQDSRKYYVIDSGLRNSITQMMSEDAGKLTENLIFIELCRNSALVYYYKEDKEVDFLILKNRIPSVAIQVTDSDLFDEKTKQREIDGLISCQKKTKVPRLILVNKSKSGIEKNQNTQIEYVTILEFLLNSKLFI